MPGACAPRAGGPHAAVAAGATVLLPALAPGACAGMVLLAVGSVGAVAGDELGPDVAGKPSSCCMRLRMARKQKQMQHAYVQSSAQFVLIYMDTRIPKCTKRIKILKQHVHISMRVIMLDHRPLMTQCCACAIPSCMPVCMCNHHNFLCN